MTRNINTKIITAAALLIAMEIVLSRFFSISTPIVKIGFGFVPVAVCALLFGPLWAGLAGALADIIGAILFPIGPYFPGFTLSAALSGLVFGLFLYKKKGTVIQIFGAVLINGIGISLLLSTFWLKIITGASFPALLPARLLQNSIMIPVQFITLYILIRRFIRNEAGHVIRGRH